MLRSRCGSQQNVRYKSPIEPVTDADIEADEILGQRLRGAFPNDGWLSEETVDSPERLQKSRVWIVDPLDGTREFVAGRPEFTVSVGLCIDGRAMLGVIANPMTGDVLSAIRGKGAYLNNKVVKVSRTSTLSPGTDVIVSRSELQRGLVAHYEGHLPMRPVGGMAHKLALITDGRADATFTCHERCEWDVAAGVVILEEAGGRVSRLDGSPLQFNRKSPIFTGIAASNTAIHESLLNALTHFEPI